MYTAMQMPVLASERDFLRKAVAKKKAGRCITSATGSSRAPWPTASRPRR
jgi:hypothetical protein